MKLSEQSKIDYIKKCRKIERKHQKKEKPRQVQQLEDEMQKLKLEMEKQENQSELQQKIDMKLQEIEQLKESDEEYDSEQEFDYTTLTTPDFVGIDELMETKDERDKIEVFNQWCADEGVIMPKITYPAEFEQGLLGLKCKEDIEHREGFLYVPYKMLISLKKAQNHPVLGMIFKQNPDTFKRGTNSDWEQFQLVLFIIYEMTLGQDSYWYPYIRQMPYCQFTCYWPKEVIEATQDQCLIEELDDLRSELEVSWLMFKQAIVQYPMIFPKKFVDRGLFLNVFAQVCSRCFAYGPNSTAMIPMADNINHSDVNVSNEVINLQKHIEGEVDPNYYKAEKSMDNQKVLFDHHKIYEPKLNIEGRINRDIYKHNLELTSQETIRSLLQKKDTQVWNLPHKTDDWEEDQDSSIEEDAQEVQYKKSTKRKQGSSQKAFEFFIYKEIKNLEKKEKIRRVQAMQFGTEFEPEEKQFYDDDEFEKKEYIPIEKECEAKAREDKWIKEDKHDTEDEDYVWAKEILFRDQIKNTELIMKQQKYLTKMEKKEKQQIEDEESDEESKVKVDQQEAENQMNQTYFCMVNRMRKPFKQGQQAFNSYGDRSNAFLLATYGFCFKGNKFDSCVFWLRMDIDLTKPIVAEDMIADLDQGKDIQIVRLKKNQLNPILIGYIRQVKLNQHFGKDNPYKRHILLSKVRDLEYEYSCLTMYQRVINLLLKHKEQQTTLEQDLELLQNDAGMSWQMKMAVVHRSEQKRILKSQLHIVQWLSSIVHQSLKMHKQLLKGVKFDQIHLLYKQLYMSTQEKPLEDLENLYPENMTAKEEERYQYRILHAKAYLKEVYQLITAI